MEERIKTKVPALFCGECYKNSPKEILVYTHIHTRARGSLFIVIAINMLNR